MLVVLSRLVEQRRPDLHHVILVPLESHLVTLGVGIQRLERVPPDEVVVELDIEVVPERMWSQVVVLDVIRHEGATDRPGSLVAIRREPLPVGLHVVPAVDRRKWRRDPARLEGIGGVCPGPHL